MGGRFGYRRGGSSGKEKSTETGREHLEGGLWSPARRRRCLRKRQRPPTAGFTSEARRKAGGTAPCPDRSAQAPRRRKGSRPAKKTKKETNPANVAR